MLSSGQWAPHLPTHSIHDRPTSGLKVCSDFPIIPLALAQHLQSGKYIDVSALSSQGILELHPEASAAEVTRAVMGAAPASRMNYWTGL